MSITTNNIKIYEFDDLAEEVKMRVLDNYRHEFDALEFFADDIICGFKTQQKAQGFIIDKVNYTGFHSQGDGASFTGYVQLEDFIKVNDANGHYKFLLPFIKAGHVEDIVLIDRSSSNYVHEGTCAVGEIEVYTNDYERLHQRLCSLCEDLQADIEAERILLCHRLYGRLEKEYSYTISDEYIQDEIFDRDFLFNKNGNRIDHLLG